MSKKYDKLGNDVFNKVEKINSELFTLTYGALVTQLIKDYEDIEQVNIKLEQMGYNIGIRLIEEFLAKSGIGRCSDFIETAEVIAKVGFKMFLGVNAHVGDWDADRKEFHLTIEDNPLIDFVELPDQYKHKLYYSNILCGVMRGALEMVQMKVKCTFVKCTLSDDSTSEIKVVLEEVLSDMIPCSSSDNNSNNNIKRMNDKEINSEKSKRAINHFGNKKEIKNSDRRGILFSKLPSQQLNPDRYDNLMTFWNNSLIDISKSCNILIFTPKLLSTYFTVENVSPIYLPLILNEMIKTKFIVKYEEYIKDYGWSKWVWTKMVVQPFQYYTGLSTPNTETEKNVKFILPEMIKDKAEQLYQHQLKNMNSTTDNIISYINLEKSIKDWFITREELDLLLLVLFRDSKVLILTNNKIKNINNININNNGEDRIGIKFAFDGEKVQPIQETDFGILKLQTTYEALKQQESKLLTDIEEISNTIKESIRIKQKNHALLQLKKKKLLESILEKRATASTNIHEILFSIESAKSNQQIIESLCTGVSTLKKVNQEISVDQVDSILDDYQDAITNQREIDDAMKSGFNSVESLSSADIDEDQLEKELDQMLQDHLTLEKEEKQKQKQIEKEKQQQPQQPPTSQFNPNLPIPSKNEEDELLKELESLSVTSNPLPQQDENKQKTSELI
ncbi:hypothetical protein ACTFIW_004170 [Dictyostelium discoideum]